MIQAINNEFLGKNKNKHKLNEQFLKDLANTTFSDLVMDGGDQEF